MPRDPAPHRAAAAPLPRASLSRAPLVRAGLATLPLVLLALAGCKDEAPKPAAPPPAAVTVLPVKPETVAITTELPGRTTPFRTAEVRPQVGGVIQERLFAEGAQTTAGQPLYQIDPAPFEASLQSAQASQARAEAAVVSARSTVNRYQPLVRARAVAQQDLDNALATLRQAEADVASAKASVTTARLNLGYTKVVAPIPGRTSRSSVTAGALVTADQATSLVTITSSTRSMSTSPSHPPPCCGCGASWPPAGSAASPTTRPRSISRWKTAATMPGPAGSSSAR